MGSAGGIPETVDPRTPNVKTLAAATIEATRSRATADVVVVIKAQDGA